MSEVEDPPEAADPLYYVEFAAKLLFGAAFASVALWLILQDWASGGPRTLRPWVATVASHAMWVTVASGLAWAATGVIRKRGWLRIVGRFALLAAGAFLPIASSVMSVHRQVIDVVEYEGETYGVMQTIALLAPDSYVEIGRLKDRDTFSEHFEIIATTMPHDYGKLGDATIIAQGTDYHRGYAPEYGFIHVLEGGIIVAGTGRGCVEVGYGAASGEALDDDELSRRFGPCLRPGPID